MSLGSPLPSKDGKKLFVVGRTFRGELIRHDSMSGQFSPFLGGISAEYTAFSKNAQWVVYVSLFIAKGLLYWHWQVLLGSGDSAIGLLITDAAAEVFDQLFFTMNVRNRVIETLPGGTFAYQGIHGEPGFREAQSEIAMPRPHPL